MLIKIFNVCPMQECAALSINTQHQALEYLGAKVSIPFYHLLCNTSSVPPLLGELKVVHVFWLEKVLYMHPAVLEVLAA